MVDFLEYPNVSLPIKDYESYLKFLQFTHGPLHDDFLFFSPMDNSDETYCSIAQYFLCRFHLTFMWERGLKGLPIPIRDGDGYQIIGAGIGKVSRKNKRIIVARDPLNDYELGIYKLGLEKVVKSMDGWVLEIVKD